MVFRAAIGAGSAYSQIKQIMADTRAACVQYEADIAANGANANELLSLLNFLQTQYLRLDTLDDAPGVAEEARRDTNDPTYDVVPEYLTARNAIAAARDGIKAALPTGTGGRPDLYEWSADGFSVVPRSFTAGQTASILPLLAAVIAAITTDFVVPV